MKIALDLDGVLYRWHEMVYNEQVLYHGETREYGEWARAFWKEDHSTIYWDNLTKLDILYSQALPDKGLVADLKELSKFNTLYYITHRPEYVRITTEHYLERYDFPQRENLIMTSGDKSLLVRGLNIDIVVEDRVEILKDCVEYADCFLVKQPWNSWGKDATLGMIVVDDAIEFCNIIKYAKV